VSYPYASLHLQLEHAKQRLALVFELRPAVCDAMQPPLKIESALTTNEPIEAAKRSRRMPKFRRASDEKAGALQRTTCRRTVADRKPSLVRSATLLRNEKMNNHVSLLLEAEAAKRKLAQLFQSEGLGQANDPSTAIVAGESIPAIQTDLEQASKQFRENCGEHGFVRSRAQTALRASQPGQMKRDLSGSGFVFILVLVGAILAGYTDRPVFWLLIGPAPVAVLHTLRTFLRQRLRRQEGLLQLSERDR
jgi:hypothetical protein